MFRAADPLGGPSLKQLSTVTLRLDPFNAYVFLFRALAGLYARARRGDASELPGVGVAYEPPLAPEVVADGGFDDAAVAAIAGRLDRKD